MTNKNGVFITSAINANNDSVFKPQDRFIQTLRTIETVRERVPNSVIFLVDSSVTELDVDMKKQIVDKVDYFVDFSKDATLKQIANQPHKDTLQNFSELITLIKAFSVIKNKKLFDDCDRIFKISGRYYLTENFDISRHNHNNKFVFFKKTLSQFPFVLSKQSLQYMTRTFSFDAALLDTFIGYMKTMLEHMQETSNDKRYIDMEHSFCKFIPQESIVELGRMGVAGLISKTGTPIED